MLCDDNNSSKIARKFWRNKAYLAALLFSVHPIHIESVSGIVGRADVLAAILFFLAFLMYHKAIISSTKLSHMIYLISTVLLSGVSMLCKENGITVLVCRWITLLVYYLSASAPFTY